MPDDGRYVATSTASALDAFAADTNGVADVYVRHAHPPEVTGM